MPSTSDDAGKMLRGEREYMTPEEVLQFARENNVKFVDVKFTDLPGSWQHFSFPLHQLSEESFVEGVPFDGSSIRGFQSINESDMLVIPDASTAILDPFTAIPTLSLICNIAHPGPAGAKKPYSRDPRYVAQKAEEYLRNSGVADVAYLGPEAEFYIFDQVSYRSTDNTQFVEIDSDEAHWNSGRPTSFNGSRSLGHLMRVKEGYFPVAPNDTYQDLRAEMALKLEELGVTIEAQHHEVGAAGQAEIDIRFDTLLRTADKMLLYKYVVKNTARKYGKTVTFMPKPIFGDNGSGMHTHLSMWKDDSPLFFDADGYAGLSRLARFYIGGILTHAPALLAIAAPTTNSYKRLVPGFEAPVNLVFSKGNRSAAVRIPLTDNPKAKRVEFRSPDPTANPYLLFSALLMAGLDGIRRELDPSDHGYGPVDRDLYSMTAEELREISSVPGSLEESLSALENDHAFLLEGGVFTSDLLEKYIDLKREQADQIRLRPVPIEFSFYYDA
jgi:glutamine synthetase